MAGPNYTVIPQDWQNLEYIIADLSNRIINEDASFSDYILADGSRVYTSDGDGFKDEDNMASNSDVATASQQSIKAYVDDTASDLVSGLTVNQLVDFDGTDLRAVADLTDYILQGSADQVIVTDEGDGTATLSLPQDINTTSSPTFADITATGTVSAEQLTSTDDATITADLRVGRKIEIFPDALYQETDGILYIFAEGSANYLTLTSNDAGTSEIYSVEQLYFRCGDDDFTFMDNNYTVGSGSYLRINVADTNPKIWSNTSEIEFTQAGGGNPTVTLDLSAASPALKSSVGAFYFDDDQIWTSAKVDAGELNVDNININGNTINCTSGDLTITASGSDISLDDDNLTTTGTITAEHLTSTDDAYITDNLGIGTNTPAERLHIYGDDYGDALARFQAIQDPTGNSGSDGYNLADSATSTLFYTEDVSWNNENNVKTDDNNFAHVTFTGAGEFADSLEAYNFGFSLPAGAVVTGFQVKVDCEAVDENIFGEIKLFTGGVGAPNEEGYSEPLEQENSTRSEVTEGGSSNMWGTSLTKADVEDSGFGVFIFALEADDATDFRVYDIQVKVYYDYPSGVANTWVAGCQESTGSFKIVDYTSISDTYTRLTIDTTGYVRIKNRLKVGADSSPSANLDVQGTTILAGSSDTEQVIVKAHSSQSNSNPLVQLQKSDGTALVNFHSDDISNLFIGKEAGIANTVGGGEAGQQNTFIGSEAGKANTSGSKNFFMGYQAGVANTTGYSCVAIGRQALKSHTEGYNNIAIGTLALEDLTTGLDNIAIGGKTLQQANSNGNVAIGHAALTSQTGSDGRNTAIGTRALDTLTSGAYNVAVGRQAGDAVTSGSSNVFIGHRAGRAITTTDTGIYIGSNAGIDETAANKLFIDSLDRGSEANGRSKSLIYGVFNADPSSQELYLHAQTQIGYNGNYTQINDNGDISFAGTAGFYPVRLAQAAQPTPDTGELVVWRDTDDGKVYLVYNDTDSGVKQVEMT